MGLISQKTAAAALCLLLMGCATQQQTVEATSASGVGQEREAFLAPQVKIELPFPTTGEWSKKQLLTFDYKGQQSQIFAAADYKDGAVRIATMEPIAATALVEIFDDGHRISMDRKAQGAALVSAAQLLTDLFLTQLDAGQWASVLPSGWSLLDSGLERRLLDREGREVSIVHYAENCPTRTPVRFVHHLFDYSIAIFDFDCPDAKESAGTLAIASRLTPD